MTQQSKTSVGHTPGPWVVTGEMDRIQGGEVIRPIDKTHSPVAILCDFNRYDRDDERRANAQLIAAAPSLLATAKALLAVLDEHGIRKAAVEMRVPLYERAADMIEAIAKAQGRS